MTVRERGRVSELGREGEGESLGERERGGGGAFEGPGCDRSKDFTSNTIPPITTRCSPFIFLGGVQRQASGFMRGELSSRLLPTCSSLLKLEKRGGAQGLCKRQER